VTAVVVERYPLTKGLKSMLNSGAVPRPDGAPDRFEISKAPTNVPKDNYNRVIYGYGIIYPLTSPMFWGSLENPEEVLTASYQITYHGRSDEHAQSLADSGHKAITLRSPNGLFLNPITASPGVVIHRTWREAGTLEEGPGGLWQVPYVYDLEVQALAA
jgi:hypothetical protein